MKQNNQFEISVRNLTEMMPSYTRKAFENFLKVEQELNDKMQQIFVSSPYQASKYLDAIIVSDGDIIAALSSVLGSLDCLTLKRFVTCDEISANVDDNDFCRDIDSTDIEAPLVSVRSVITAMPCSVAGTSDVIKCAAPVIVQPEYLSWANNNIHNADRQGNITILDYLRSECCVDIQSLMTSFFKYIIKTSGVVIDERAPTTIETWNTIHNTARDENIMNKMIDLFSKSLLKSAVATYLIYAGKLIGAKTDVYSWMYTSFVKNNMSDVEKGNYPTSSDITLNAKMQDPNSPVNSDSTGHDALTGKDNVAGKRDINNNIFTFNAFSDGSSAYNKVIFYKNIQLQYSNWAVIIDIISKINYKPASEWKFDWIEEDNNKISQCIDFKHSIVSMHAEVAKKVLAEYITEKYRTYNTPVQCAVNKSSTANSDAFLEIASNRIYDTETRAIIKDICSEKTYDNSMIDYYLPYNDDVNAVIRANQLACNGLADQFMSIAYLCMLDYIHVHQDTVLSQDDPITGKPKRELFEEIYSNLKSSISSYFSAFIDPCILSGIIMSGREKASQFGKYTGILKDAYVPVANRFNRSTLYDELNMTNLVESGIVKSTNDNEDSALKYIPIDKFICDMPLSNGELLTVANAYIVPPLSSVCHIVMSNWIGEQCDIVPSVGVTSYHDSSYIPDTAASLTRNAELFPKNGVIVEQLDKMRLHTNRIFNSMEAVSSAIDDAEAKESEWPQMNHDDIGAIGGAVYDMEIINESDTGANDDAGNAPQVTNDNAIEQVNGKDTPVNDPDVGTDMSTGNMTVSKPHDSDDVSTLTAKADKTSGNTAVNPEISFEEKTVERYNKLFNRVVFGIK